MLSLMLLFSLAAACEKYPWEDEPATREEPGFAAADDESAASQDEPGEASDDPDSDSIGRVLKGEMKHVYRYTDKKGVVNYVDSIDKVPPRYRKVAKHPSGGVVNIFPSTSIDEVVAREKIDLKKYKRKPGQGVARHGQVILYTTSWCGYCKKARKFLQQKGVAFEEKNVGRNRANLEEMLQKSGGARGVPVLDVDGRIIRGFSARAYSQALAK